MENLFGTRYSGRRYTYPVLLKYTYPIIITTENSHTINGEEPEKHADSKYSYQNFESF